MNVIKRWRDAATPLYTIILLKGILFFQLLLLSLLFFTKCNGNGDGNGCGWTTGTMYNVYYVSQTVIATTFTYRLFGIAGWLLSRIQFCHPVACACTVYCVKRIIIIIIIGIRIVEMWNRAKRNEKWRNTKNRLQFFFGLFEVGVCARDRIRQQNINYVNKTIFSVKLISDNIIYCQSFPLV